MQKLPQQLQILLLQLLTDPFGRKRGNCSTSALDLSAGCELGPILRGQKQSGTRPLALNLVGKLQHTMWLEGFAVLRVHKHHIRMIRLEEDESPAYF